MRQRLNRQNSPISIGYEFFLWSGVIYSGWNICRNMGKLIQTNKRVKELLNEDVIDNNFQELKGRGNKVVLLRLNCKSSDLIKEIGEVTSLQKFTNLYPIQQNNDNICNYIPPSYEWLSRQFSTRFKFCRVASEDIFQIKHSYKQSERNWFMNVIVGIGTVLSIAGNLILGHSDYGFFKGPNVGTLISTYSLMTDQPIVVQCLIEDGQFIPKVMGISKQTIIDYYERQNTISIVQVVCSTFIFLYLSNKLIGLFQFLDLKRAVKGSKLFRDQQDCNLMKSQGQECIICMKNSRNIIFGNCSHCLICDQCYSQSLQQFNKCPMCRAQVNNSIISIRRLK